MNVLEFIEGAKLAYYIQNEPPILQYYESDCDTLEIDNSFGSDTELNFSDWDPDYKPSIEIDEINDEEDNIFMFS